MMGIIGQRGAGGAEKLKHVNAKMSNISENSLFTKVIKIIIV